MPIYELDGQAPELPGEGQCLIADSAAVIGRVRLKKQVSIWFGAVLRGDNEWIEIGERSDVQDNCTLHTDPGFPIMIGSNTLIGHNVVLHGATVGNNSLIGMGASAAQRRQDRRQLPGRRRCAGDRGQELSGQFADRGLACARDPRARPGGN